MASPGSPDPMRTAFVTGAGGLVGFWLVAALLDRGVRVVTLLRRPDATSGLRITGLADRCEVVPGDVRDADLVGRVLAEHDVDSVFHLAAQPILAEAITDPVTTFETNVRATWGVLDAARAHGVQRAVVASTGRVYGPRGADAPPAREDDPLASRHPYDASKAAAELVACSYPALGLPVAVARLANVYGGGDLNPSRLVPELVSAVLGGRAPRIHTDGSPERDLLHGEDAAAALLALADRLGPGPSADPVVAGEAFNVASGVSVSVRDATERLIALSGSAVPAEYGPPPPGGPDRQALDPSKLRRATGWTPRHELDAGLRATLDWYRAHPEALAR